MHLSVMGIRRNGIISILGFPTFSRTHNLKIISTIASKFASKLGIGATRGLSINIIPILYLPYF